MLPIINKYDLFPSVYKAHESAELAIVANERRMVFAEGEEFIVNVIAVDREYDDLEPTISYSVCASGGVVKFSHKFLDEQEYRIVLLKDDVKVFETSVYALEEDLYGLVPLMGDLHSHSCYSDGTQDPTALAGYMRERGYDFYAMTDHNRFFPSLNLIEAIDTVRSGLVVLRGEEVHCPSKMPLHIVHVGGRKSVDEIYINNEEEYKKEFLDYMARVPEEVAEKYKERYAVAMWASDHIHAVGGVAIFPHPFWRPKKWMRRYVSTEFASLMIKSGLFDAYELLGAMGQGEVNASVAFWNDLRAEGVKIPVVGSSDVHGVQGNPEFPWQRTVLFAKEKSEESILRAIKDGMSVAVEVTGTDYNTQYRVYGSLRFVNYTQFLMRYYFARTSMLAYGEGLALRAYFMGDAPAQQVELQAAACEKFTRRFFGKESAPDPSSELLEKAVPYNEQRGAYQIIKKGNK